MARYTLASLVKTGKAIVFCAVSAFSFTPVMFRHYLQCQPTVYTSTTHLVMITFILFHQWQGLLFSRVNHLDRQINTLMWVFFFTCSQVFFSAFAH